MPCANDSFQLHTDTSKVAIGAVLNVLREGQDRPVAFFSRQLRDVECRYSATELEAVAIVEAVKHSSHYLYGTHFEVVTDHKPQIGFLYSKCLNHRLKGMAIKLSQ